MNAKVEQQQGLYKKLVSKFLVKFCAYFDGDLYLFADNSGELSFVKSSGETKQNVLIVSSDFYTETKHDYPVSDKKELLKLVQLQLEEKQRFLIQNITESKSVINSWCFSEQVPKAWLRIPESLLFAQSINNGDVLSVFNRQQEVTFFTVFNQVIQSAKCKGVINSAENFALSVGISVEKESTIVHSDKASVFARAITCLSLAQLTAFWVKPSRLKLKNVLSSLVIPGMFVYFSYLLIGSIYLNGKISYLESQLAQQDSKVSRLLQIQTDVENKQNYNQKLNEFWSDKNSIAALWVALNPIFETVDIRSIVRQNEKFIIRGRTEDASALLDRLASEPNILLARFEAPVRKQRNKDSFQISIELHKGKVVLDNKLADDAQGVTNE